MNHLSHVTLSPADRSAEILGQIRKAFAEKGFDGASMQDLARAAGMSVGNFYRYFPSKAAIVEAMVGHDMAEMGRDFAAIITSGHPMEALRGTIRRRIESCGAEDSQLWAEMTAASLRKPEIGAIVRGMEEMVIENLMLVFSRATNLPACECRDRYAAHARLVVMMVKASSTRNGLSTDAASLTTLILRTIDRTLDDISADSSKG